MQDIHSTNIFQLLLYVSCMRDSSTRKRERDEEEKEEKEEERQEDKTIPALKKL